MQADEGRECTSRFVEFEVIVRSKNDTSERCVDALGELVIEGLDLTSMLTVSPNEYKSVGLLSSPLKWPSGLRQLSFPASIPLIHLGFGR